MFYYRGYELYCFTLYLHSEQVKIWELSLNMVAVSVVRLMALRSQNSTGSRAGHILL